jgi:hypothetical protein
VQVHVGVERRAEAVEEGDGAEPRADGGLGRVTCDACRSAQQLLDLSNEDSRDGCDSVGSVGEHAAQSLRHGNHPLPHGHRRDDVIGETGCGLGHVPTVAGGADAPSLAGEGHDKTLAASRAESACEFKAEDAALEIAAEFLLDVARHGPLGAVALLELTLEVLRHDLVERRLLGAATLGAACRRGAAMWSEAGPRGKRGGGSDHGQRARLLIHWPGLIHVQGIGGTRCLGSAYTPQKGVR